METTVFGDNKMFGKDPTKVKCGRCHHEITTRVEDSVTAEGYLFCCCCCLFGSWINSLLV